MQDDPFFDVLNDVQEQLDDLNKSTTPLQGKDLQEIQETIKDLKSSLQLIREYLSAEDAQSRQLQIEHVERQYNLLSKRQPLSNNISENIELQEGGDSGDAENGDENVEFDHLESQMLHEQDSHLDQISRTMQNLRKQAHMMGDELHEHTDILNSIDTNIDSVQGKLKRNIQKLEWIYEKNKEVYNTICIMVLIVVLIILLFMTIIA